MQRVDDISAKKGTSTAIYSIYRQSAFTQIINLTGKKGEWKKCGTIGVAVFFFFFSKSVTSTHSAKHQSVIYSVNVDECLGNQMSGYTRN